MAVLYENTTINDYHNITYNTCLYIAGSIKYTFYG